MCGICGIVGYRHDGAIKQMTETLSHRGPDNIGVKFFGNDRVALGHTKELEFRYNHRKEDLFPLITKCPSNLVPKKD
jgi:glutamine phosphoribosylpyrophosphate amidotransferase